MCAASMAFIEDSGTAKKYKQAIKQENFFAALASANARRRNCKEKKKDDPSLAIGENYINKMFLFFNILFRDVFTYRLTAKNQKILAAEKEGKKLPQLFPHLLFILFLRVKD